MDEEVILDEHEGTIYYDFPLNRLGKVNQNKVNKITGERQVFESLTYHARPVAPQHGDTIIQGRFGNYINLTSELEMNAKPAYPKIVIGGPWEKSSPNDRTDTPWVLSDCRRSSKNLWVYVFPAFSFVFFFNNLIIESYIILFLCYLYYKIAKLAGH